MEEKKMNIQALRKSRSKGEEILDAIAAKGCWDDRMEVDPTILGRKASPMPNPDRPETTCCAKPGPRLLPNPPTFY